MALPILGQLVVILLLDLFAPFSAASPIVSQMSMARQMELPMELSRTSTRVQGPTSERALPAPTSASSSQSTHHPYFHSRGTALSEGEMEGQNPNKQ